jgi:hypothetical protein
LQIKGRSKERPFSFILIRRNSNVNFVVCADDRHHDFLSHQTIAPAMMKNSPPTNTSAGGSFEAYLPKTPL